MSDKAEENKEVVLDYMARLLREAISNIVNKEITSVADQIMYHRLHPLGYLRKF